MDKAVIIGVYEFLGFHFCQKLLNKGMEVKGLHLEKKGKSIFLEEKRMEIGRNANFSEYSYDEYLWKEDDLEELLIIMDYYDLFMARREKELFTLFPLKNLFAHLKSSQIRFILLFPIQFIYGNKFEKQRLQAERLLQKIGRGKGTVSVFYLPSVFGPWQSEEFTFQKYLLGENDPMQDTVFNDREWTGDAVYVEEVVRTVLQTCSEQTDMEEYILVSGEEDSWNKCARLLSLPLQQKVREFPRIRQVQMLILDQQISIESALMRQQRHTERLKSLY